MRKFYGYALAFLFVLVIALIAEIGIPATVAPQLSKVSYNDSLPTNWVGRDESLRANFSGHFYVIVNRNFGRITIWVTPKEGARTEYIGVEVRRKFLNELYMEVEPPWYGKVEINREDDSDGMRYLIQVKDLGESGEGTVELTFIDRAPEEIVSMKITVEVREGPFKYRGELPVVIPDPFCNCTLTG